MSILQEYEQHSKYINRNKLNAIKKYLDYIEANIYYSDVIYKKAEWEKFEKWYKTVYNIKYGKSSKGD